MPKRVVFLVAAAAFGCAFSSWADEVQKPGSDKIADADVLFEQLTRGQWCKVWCESPDVFVINKKHLEKPLERLGDKIKKLKDKDVRRGGGKDPDHDFTFCFYLWDGKKMTVLGEFGFWKNESDRMELTPEDKPRGYLRFPHADGMAFLKEVKPALHNIGNALEALDAPDKRFKRLAMTSVSDRRFAAHFKEVLPTLEPFLSDKDEQIRNRAAESILRIAPDHMQAKKVLQKTKQ
jgi:hypothetical protein